MIPTHNLLLVSSLKFIRNASRDPNRIDIYTCLKLDIQKMNIMASGPLTSWEIDGETVSDFIFWGL